MKIDPIVLEIPEGVVTKDDLVRIESKLDSALEALRFSTGIRSDKHVLNTQEAMQFVNCKNRTSFSEWIKEFAPFSRVKINRYSRARLETGRQREINKGAGK